jgi:adenosyl cobinamide kinase/adenosyl cobinamide phosphate guanylyltransferase
MYLQLFVTRVEFEDELEHCVIHLAKLKASSIFVTNEVGPNKLPRLIVGRVVATAASWLVL